MDNNAKENKKPKSEKSEKMCTGCAIKCCLICYSGTFNWGEDLCIYCRGNVICKNNSEKNRVAEAWVKANFD